MKKILFLLIMMTISLYSFAPAEHTIDIKMETLKEIEIRTTLELIEANRLKVIRMADSAAMFILDKYRRKKSDNQHEAFINKVKSVSDSLGIHFSWLVGIMHHESRLNHRALNSIRAVGLIQFLPSTARGLGTSTNALYNMSGVQQLNYVYKFYKHAKGNLNEATDLYLYAFFPIAILNNWPDSRIIAYGKLSAKIIAKHNRGLDTNKDGVITVGEVRKEALQHCPFEMLS